MDAPRTDTTERMVREHLDYLAVADPEAARRLAVQLADADPGAYAPHLARVVDEVIDALTLEVSFGRLLAEGMGRILAGGEAADLGTYRRLIRTAAANGPTLAGLFARHLVPVMIHGDADMAERFEATTRIMLQKGTYTLKAPLESLSALLQAGDIDCARAFLALLTETYAQPITYNRTVYLTHTLPRAVDGFSPPRRLSLIKGLTRVIRTDERLADDFIQGCTTGLQLLSEPALDAFLEQAMRRHGQSPQQGARFLSLESHLAREACRNLQVTVPLAAVRADLERYVRARTGLAVTIRPFSDLSAGAMDADGKRPLVHCDGRSIYLPDEMGLMDHRAENADVYKLLVRLEAGSVEFGTYDLDADKALGADMAGRGGRSSLACVLDCFSRPLVALDLFTLIEHGRVARNVRHHYPGLDRRLCTALTDQGRQPMAGYPTGGTLLPLYQTLVLGRSQAIDPILQDAGGRLGRWLDRMPATSTATASAQAAAACYPALAALIDSGAIAMWEPLSLPLGRRLTPDAFAPFDTVHHRMAVEIRARLAQRGIRVFRSDLQEILERQNGRISAADIRSVIAGAPSAGASADLGWLDLESLIDRHGSGRPGTDAGDAHAFRYPEWDGCMGDYLPNRVRVLERRLTGSDSRFYGQALEVHRGLVKRIRYAFELLRPEAITILRQWREGECFDYRALLDYAMDKRAGRMPSDRLFVKRIKRIRDVAALLLVDLSRSTANAVDPAGICVLDVEKQAIVLLCEALKVVGDRFAIAGFSGTGPLGVDYYRIKDLDEPFDDTVKGRISAMTPLRSTRMGAAIRHAAAQLAPVAARVRLILVLGDGYPNDLEYKGNYAVADTRRAVMEARAEAIHVKAITINAGDNGQLDRLYGQSHHTLIGNVRDLPDKLVRVYSALTRH